MGDCRNSIFWCFLPFLAKKVVQIPDLAKPDFFKANFLTFCKKIGTVGRPTVPDFLAFQIQISRFPDFLPDFLCIPM